MRNYWSNKDELSKKAKEQNVLFADKYKDEIASCVNKTKVYTRKDFYNKNDSYKGKPEFRVKMMTTFDAIFNSKSKNMCALNFASYKNPGGCFLEGSSAQEESLCHNSILYNVLKEKVEYYEFNKKNLNKGMYMDRALYSKDILFIKGDRIKNCDILTCAAPNRSVALRYGNFTDNENSKALEDRVEFIRKIVDSQENLDEIILGAWGCGVFKQDMDEVAKLLVKYFSDSKVKIVTFALLDNKSCETFYRYITKRG